MAYTTITTEGGLLPADILDAIAAGETGGQQAADFGLERTARLSDEIAAAWGDARVYWDAFQRTLRRLRQRDTGTSETRDRWIIPLLEILGYRDITYQPAAAVVEGRTYAISHRAGRDEEALPLHIEGFKSKLDTRPPTGRPRLSPHALVQEYLNSTEHLWSIVTNGEKLRLLRDSSRITRPSYVEFDLRAMLEGEVFNEFSLLYRLLHRSRLPETPADAPTCWLERYYQQAIEQGGRVREGLRGGVEKALLRLGNGFLQHPANDTLRQQIATGNLKPLEYYRQLLRLVYRLLFLMVAEERRLIAADDTTETPSHGAQAGDAAQDVADHADGNLGAQAARLHTGGQDARAPRSSEEEPEPWLQQAVVTSSGAFLPPAATDALRIYYDNYSISRLRRLAEHRGAGRGPYDDLWLGLNVTFRLLEGSDEAGAHALGLAALDGDLFSDDALRNLHNTRIRNADLLGAIHALSLYRDPQSKYLRRVNYGALDVEELGSVYESLLDYRPVVDYRSVNPSFALVVGTERKTTGSYYTRPELVQELIKSTLDPIIDARLHAANRAGNGGNGKPRKHRDSEHVHHGDTEAQREHGDSVQEKNTKSLPEDSCADSMSPRLRGESELLSIRVCDPACGSGHFLLAAARRIGRALAAVRSGEDQPTPSQFRRAVRDVIAHCIYGVDLNPLAVDLCKLALWIEGHNAGMPLSFLDSHIRVGNSLVGASAELVAQGIPDDAFKPVTGDDKTIAAALRKRNKQERKDQQAGQLQMDLDTTASPATAALADGLRQLEATPDNAVATIRDKARRYHDLREQARHQFVLYDLWCAAFFQPFTAASQPTAITTHTLHEHQHTSLPFDHPIALAAWSLAHEPELRFFHWELEFPQVFQQTEPRPPNPDPRTLTPGFDVVLGNPPWERIKLQEQEHFVDVPAISKAANKAARERAIKQWRDSDDPAKQQRIAEFDRAKQRAEATSRFIRTSGRFPLTAVGDVNTYALFAELDRNLVNAHGRAGIIVPTGIATDNTTRAFFGDLMTNRNLVSFFGMDNEKMIFPGIDHRNTFGLLVIGGSFAIINEPDFTFRCSRVEYLSLPQRRYSLSSEDIALINPNTRTAPVFRTKADAELTKKIYRRVPVLVKEGEPEVSPWGIRFQAMIHMANDSHLFQSEAGEGLLPLYEAKMMWHFDHRYATYDGATQAQLNVGSLPHPTVEQKQDPNFAIQPRYWVAREEVEARLAGKWEREWLLGFRDVTSSVVERTAIFSLLPRVGVGNNAPLMLLTEEHATLVACLLATLNSLTFDFVARHKVGGVHMNFFIVQQLPVLPPSAFSAEDIAYIVPRVLELVYTAWDMQPFAQDVWHEMQRSDPLPAPYVWDEQRRAVLRAELDARIARLYGLTRDELRYMLDPAEVYGEDFPGETFRVLKEKEQRLYGEYRTRRLVLEAWDAGEDSTTDAGQDSTTDEHR